MPAAVNQTAPFERLPVIDPLSDEIYPECAIVNFEVDTPLDHWSRGGCEWPPPGTSPRLQMLREWRRLHDGDLDAILRGHYPVRTNYFRASSVELVDLLMAFPPRVAGIPPALQRSIDRALPQAITDISRFGTCLLRPWRAGGDVMIEAPTPEGWFPAGDGDAVVTVAGKELSVRIMPHDGPHMLRVYEGGDDPESREPDGIPATAAPIKLLSETEISPVIAGPNIFSAELRPGAGKWGQSLYGPMYPLVAEVCRRQSKQSETLDDNSNPLLVLIRDESYEHDGLGEPEASEFFELYERRKLSEWRRRTIASLPERYRDAKYLSWDAQMQATTNSIQGTLQALYAVNPLMPLVLGLLSGNDVVQGGMSIRKVFASTWFFALRVTHGIEQALRAALDAAGITDVEIDWPDAMSEIDVLTVVQEGAGGAAGDQDIVDDPQPDAPEGGG